jgi:hypothetical protein
MARTGFRRGAPINWISPLALGASATSIVVLVAVWDTLVHPESHPASVVEAREEVGS